MRLLHQSDRTKITIDSKKTQSGRGTAMAEADVESTRDEGAHDRGDEIDTASVRQIDAASMRQVEFARLSGRGESLRLLRLALDGTGSKGAHAGWNPPDQPTIHKIARLARETTGLSVAEPTGRLRQGTLYGLLWDNAVAAVEELSAGPARVNQDSRKRAPASSCRFRAVPATLTDLLLWDAALGKLPPTVVTRRGPAAGLETTLLGAQRYGCVSIHRILTVEWPEWGSSSDEVVSRAADNAELLCRFLEVLLWSEAPWHDLGLCASDSTILASAGQPAVADNGSAAREVHELHSLEIRESAQGPLRCVADLRGVMEICPALEDGDMTDAGLGDATLRRARIVEATALQQQILEQVTKAGVLSTQELRVKGLVVLGQLSLEGIRIGIPLSFVDCTFLERRSDIAVDHDEYDGLDHTTDSVVRGRLAFQRSFLQRLSLHGCVFGKLDLDFSHVDSSINVSASSGTSFNLAGAHIGDELRFDNVGWLPYDRRTHPIHDTVHGWLGDPAQATTPELNAKYLTCPNVLLGGEFGRVLLYGGTFIGGLFLGNQSTGALHASALDLDGISARVMVADQVIVHAVGETHLKLAGADLEGETYIGRDCIVLGCIDLSGLRAKGEVSILARQVGTEQHPASGGIRSAILLNNARLDGGVTIGGGRGEDSMSVYGGVSLEEATVDGDVRMINVEVFDQGADGASRDSYVAIDLVGLEVTGRIELKNTNARGPLRAFGADADAMILSNSRFLSVAEGPAQLSYGPRPSHLPKAAAELDRATIHRTLEITECSFTGDVSMNYLQAGEVVVGRREKETTRIKSGAFRGQAMRVAGTLKLDVQRETEGESSQRGASPFVRLTDARISLLELSDVFGWEESGVVRLTDATLQYLKITGVAGDPLSRLTSSVRMLLTVQEREDTEYDAGGYRTLAEVVARNGDMDTAIDIAVQGERQRLKRRVGTDTAMAGHKVLLETLGRWAHGVWGVVADFGYRPGKSLWGLSIAVGLAAVMVVLGWRLGWFVSTINDGPWLSNEGACPSNSPCFSPVPYLLQTLFPVLDLGQVQAWAATTWWLGTTLALCTTVAWALSLLGALALASTSRRQLVGQHGALDE